ncbi:MAG: alpha/beta hydrolase family protein [Sphingobacterium sp.]
MLHWTNKIVGMVCLSLVILLGACAQQSAEKKKQWENIEAFFAPPASYANAFGSYRSPLRFYNGDTVKTAADWESRRAEIQERWHGMMGEWPAIIDDQKLEILDSTSRTGYQEYRVRFRWLPEQWTEGYLLVPDEKGNKPAVITVFYEPETAIGKGKADRDFARQLTQQGFVTLSIGTSETSQAKNYSLYYPDREEASIQPLSTLAYAAANAWQVLADLPEVDSTRIGVMGHSYGGKWAMFASCLYEKFACGVWIDPGIVFDETKGSGVNYWEPWYLGYYPPPWDNVWRKTGMTEEAKGLYPTLLEEGYDLHELHALMAPRPFLVSGGSSDPEERWVPLNHTIQVNALLGYENRVAMTNREEHSPNKESNQQAVDFLNYFLK